MRRIDEQSLGLPQGDYLQNHPVMGYDDANGKTLLPHR